MMTWTRKTRWAGVLVVLAAIPLGGPASADEPREPASGGRSEVVDAAHLFSAKSVETAIESLRRNEKTSRIPTKIETVESLDGRSIEEVSLKKSARSGSPGLYVLLAKEERKIEVRVSQHFRTIVDQAALREIRDGFVNGLRKGEPDDGLFEGVGAIEKVLARVRVDEREVIPSAGRVEKGGGESSLIVRNQVRLTLAGARAIVEGAEKKAAEIKLKVNIAVVDDGGHLIHFARMDGARPASGYTATTKAVTAATFRQETGPLPKGVNPPDLLLNLSLQNAAAASGGKVTTLFGGVPVLVDDQVIGGVGVGGGTGEQDAIVAKAGIAAFLGELKGTPAVAKDEKPAEK